MLFMNFLSPFWLIRSSAEATSSFITQLQLLNSHKNARGIVFMIFPNNIHLKCHVTSYLHLNLLNFLNANGDICLRNRFAGAIIYQNTFHHVKPNDNYYIATMLISVWYAWDIFTLIGWLPGFKFFTQVRINIVWSTAIIVPVMMEDCFENEKWQTRRAQIVWADTRVHSSRTSTPAECRGRKATRSCKSGFRRHQRRLYCHDNGWQSEGRCFNSRPR